MHFGLKALPGRCFVPLVGLVAKVRGYEDRGYEDIWIELACYKGVFLREITQFTN